MAKIENSMILLATLEHSNREDKVLHKNKGEDGLTFFGIYESANPSWKGWDIVKRYLEFTPDLRECSKILVNVSDLTKLVNEFYKKKFWDKALLDNVKSQKIADEIFIFGVNVGMTVAIAKAQALVGASVDGISGSQTVRRLNEYDEDKFDILFDEEEIKYYDRLVELHSKFSINKKGWHSRARAV